MGNELRWRNASKSVIMSESNVQLLCGFVHFEEGKRIARIDCDSEYSIVIFSLLQRSDLLAG
jgi:hypothetical protein